jgi:hypothetical protein
MHPEEFLQLLRRRPFVPLRIYMTDGRVHDIYHPNIVLVLRSRIDIGVKSDPNTGVLERIESCSLLHVVRIEELHPVA